ncbi:hypothetical protein PFISCL1PPCAC_12052, partial [Pristionchus fissidentatus]
DPNFAIDTVDLDDSLLAYLATNTTAILDLSEFPSSFSIQAIKHVYEVFRTTDLSRISLRISPAHADQLLLHFNNHPNLVGRVDVGSRFSINGTITFTKWPE